MKWGDTMSVQDKFKEVIQRYEEIFGENYSDLLEYHFSDEEAMAISDKMEESIAFGIPGLMASMLPNTPPVAV